MEKQIGPIMLDYKGKMKYIRVDVNEAANRELLKKYPVRYVPTSYIMNNKGESSSNFVGAIKTDKIKKELDKAVND